MSKATRNKIWALYCEGYAVWQIASALDITEAQVVRVLGLR